MKNIFLSIQKKLSEVTELKHIDKNWSQLLYEKPPVKFPCALLNITGINYSQLGVLAQDANGIVEITIANHRLKNSSGKAPRKEEAYMVFDVIEKMHQLLQGWTNNEFQPLVRTSIQKLDASYCYEIYKVSYQTSWRVFKETDQAPVQIKTLVLTPEIK